MFGPRRTAGSSTTCTEKNKPPPPPPPRRARPSSLFSPAPGRRPSSLCSPIASQPINGPRCKSNIDCPIPTLPMSCGLDVSLRNSTASMVNAWAKGQSLTAPGKWFSPLITSPVTERWHAYRGLVNICCGDTLFPEPMHAQPAVLHGYQFQTSSAHAPCPYPISLSQMWSHSNPARISCAPLLCTHTSAAQAFRRPTTSPRTAASSRRCALCGSSPRSSSVPSPPTTPRGTPPPPPETHPSPLVAPYPDREATC